eukprot:7775764-Alexandrium_andersonii.AAC.1
MASSLLRFRGPARESRGSLDLGSALVRAKCARLLGDRMEDGGRRGRVTHGFVDRLVGVWPV